MNCVISREIFILVLNFKLISISEHTVLLDIIHHTQTVPTELVLSEDDKHVIANNKITEAAPESKDVIVFPLNERGKLVIYLIFDMFIF